MTDVVFATVDAGGNVPPLKDVAVEVARRGHRVRVLGHEQQRASFERAGLEFHAYTGSEWDPTVDRSTPQGIRAFVAEFTGAPRGADLTALLEPGSIAVVDCMQLAGLKAAQDAGTPTVALVHSFHAYFDGSWRRGPIGIIARLKGFGARKLWRNSRTVLVTADRSLDPAGSRTWPDSFVWTGPIQPEPAPSSPVAPPRVLVSLSTINFPGQQEVLQNVLDGLAAEPIEMVVTTGPAVDPASLDLPANAEAHRFLPHDDLMPACSAVIGHGGHSTTMRALAHGLPLVILPMHPMLDQAMVGKRVEQAGAGVTIKKSSSPTEIRTALDTVLNGKHRAAAKAIAERWRGTDGAAVAADRILAPSSESVSP